MRGDAKEVRKGRKDEEVRKEEDDRIVYSYLC